MITITANNGEHYSSNYPRLVRLVSATRFDDGAPGFYLAHGLKADGGINEIDAAIAAAPQITLPLDKARKALRDAF
jgi:hypothetical protein